MLAKGVIGEQNTDGVSTRLLALFLLLIAQSFAISLYYDAWDLVDSNAPNWYRWLGLSGHVVKISVVFLTAFILILGQNIRLRMAELVSAAMPPYPYWRFLVLQLLSYAAFFWLTDFIFSPNAIQGDLHAIVPVAWFLLIPTLLGFWLLSIAPFSYWLDLVRTQSKSIVIAAVVALLAWAIAFSAQSLWEPLGELTFHATSLLLTPLFDIVVVDSNLLLLGTPEFVVRIDSACSGYEGIGLVIVFLTFYLSFFREDFRFPQVLLLFPIGVLAIWLFNAIRIVVLIVIGSNWSPQVALGGFHSQAGWISFIVVSVLVLYAAHRTAYFRSKAGIKKSTGAIPQNVAILVPLVVLLSMTMLTASLAGDIDWLYPLRVLVTGAAIIVIWPRLGLVLKHVSVGAVAAGIAVFVLWILMVPGVDESSLLMAEALSGAGTWVAFLWLVMRFVGTVVTVPIAEELAFRGYLIGRLSGVSRLMQDRVVFSFFALAVSSIAFGLLHTTFLAGVVAGLLYGLVRIFCGGVGNAIIAHGITNLLLFVYVLLTQSWSLL